MEEYRDVIVFSSVALYLIMCIGVGLWALKRTTSTQDFFMAGRSLGVMLTAFAVFSSMMSGFGFVGGPGLVYRMGMSSVWMIVCAGAGYVAMFALLGKRIRLLGELKECISLPDVVSARYQSNAVRGWVAVAILLGVMGYLATQILAMAVVLKDILVESEVVPGINLEWCVAIACAVLLFYSVTGGIVASVYTDLVQGSVMVVAAVLVFITAIMTFDGGIGEMNQIIMEDDPEAMSPWGTLGIVGCLSWFFVFSFGSAGQPHLVTKIMMNKNVSDARHILPVSMMGFFLSGLLWIGIGLAMRALVLSGAHAPLDTPDAAANQFLQTYAHPLLAGVVFAGLFAAIMSTADGFLNIGTAAVVHDLPRAITGASINNELVWARVTTLVLCVVASLFALYTGDLVALLGAFGWGTFAAALVPVVGLGLCWKQATPKAAIVAIITSLVINFGLKVSGYTLPYNFDIGAFALIVSLVLFITISLLSKPESLDPEVEAVMDL